VLAAAMAVAAGLPAVGPAAADTGGMPTLTIAPDYAQAPQFTDIRAANGAGYLDGTTWHGFDGSTRPDQPRADWYSGAYGLVHLRTGGYRLHNYADGTSADVRVPDTDQVTGVFTSHSLLTVRYEGTGARTLHLLQVPPDGGDPVDRTVEGVPADLSRVTYSAVDGARAAVVYETASSHRLAELDLDTAAFTPFARTADLNVSGPPALSGDHVLAAVPGAVATFSWEQPGNGPAVDALPGGMSYASAGTAVVGDWVAVVGPSPAYAVKATPIGKNEWQTVLDRSAGQNPVSGGPAGSVVVAGGTDAEHWAVQRLAATPDGTPAAEALVPIPPVSLWQGGGLAFTHRRLLVGESGTNDSSFIKGVDVTRSATGELGSVPARTNYWMDYPAGQYSCEGACRRLTGNEELKAFNDGNSVVVTAAGYHRVVRDTGTGRQWLEDTWLGGASARIREVGSGAAALWGRTLWTPGTAAGTVVPTDAATMRAGATVQLGAPCVPRELQAVAARLYWSCGPDGPAGVFDRSTGQGTEVPSGPAQLGDGYLVSQDAAAGKLKITYLPGAVPADRAGTADLAPLPAAQGAPDDLRGLYWAVDRFGGGVAWFDASGAVRVAFPQVTASPLQATATRVEDPVFRTERPYWYPRFLFSQPIASWTFQVRETRTGALMWQASGGPLTGALTADGWNARDPLTGLPVRTGSYAWSLTATPADGTAAALKLSGQVTAKSMEPRDYGAGGSAGDDGIGDLFTVSSQGVLELQAGDGKGGVDPRRRTEATGWPTTSTLIPFGDLMGYRCNDVLERTPVGELKVWQGSCDTDFAPSNRTTSLGYGWNAYNALLSSGDQDGDGRADLLGRDKAGNLWLFANDGKGHLKPGVKVGWGLSGYTMLVGAGDLNGDRIGDLVARDSSGVLWRWLGNGKGGWNARVNIGSGFNAYNALVGVGDFDGDGRADLVGRSTAGNVFRWSGTGQGTLRAGVRITTGWSGYRALY
jgi:FG-GAP-like repeat